MSTSSYANCHFCGDVVKAVVANTHQCPTCMKKPKTCKQCGKTKTQSEFAYNMSKDSLKFEDPRNDICQKCQQAKAMTVRTEQSPTAKLKLSDAQLGIIEMVKQGMDNAGMAKKLGIKTASVRALKSKTNKMLEKAGISFESYPDTVK